MRKPKVVDHRAEEANRRLAEMIASQIDILALNAAVEAARAGEAGLARKQAKPQPSPVARKGSKKQELPLDEEFRES